MLFLYSKTSVQNSFVQCPIVFLCDLWPVTCDLWPVTCDLHFSPAGRIVTKRHTRWPYFQRNLKERQVIDLIITTKYCRGNSTTFPNRHNKLRERALPSAVNISRFSPWGLRFSPWGLRSSFLGLRFRNTRRQTLLTKHRGRKEAATKYYNYTANKADE